MLIVPALEYEKQRKNPSDWNKVILHREGKFYRSYILPGRTYMSHAALRRLRYNVDNLKGNGPAKLYRSINSMLGVMSHFDNHRLCREIFCVEQFLRHGHFSEDMTHYYLYQ